jgi:hypothetical protein
MYLIISKCVAAVKVSNFSGHYLRNRSTLDIGVLGYIGILYPKEQPPEVRHIPPGTSVYKSLGVVLSTITIKLQHRVLKIISKIHVSRNASKETFFLENSLMIGIVVSDPRTCRRGTTYNKDMLSHSLTHHY